MRKPMIAANWKMNKTLGEAIAFVQTVKNELPPASEVEAVVCSPALYLHSLVAEAKDTALKIGAQTMHYAESGAFTGEISPLSLQDLGVTHVIIGHSERREMFAETDETVNKKVLAAFNHQLIPIVCCGETLAERESGKTNELVSAQVEKGLAGLTEAQTKEVVIAYEPIWAIGTGKSSSPQEANETCAHIRSVISRRFSPEVANSIRIQYGGSVNPNNIGDFLQQSDIDGALVGGASLEPDSFLQLLEAVR